ncbi:MAG: cepB [Candidatus Saganbacteria bacterium]|uniref:CepB n=1 Tax=Candidatus Saganbacteria bacterium TaxID=2575572 RepID=A0A833L2C7_UNCSA|nr:MAG: cepB [Candidatus Saganbacteria bacterium]
MRYGYFDNENLEYVITRPDTPTPWINYIGGGQYGGIVSNTGGGYSFDKDPKNKRVLRYRYNSIPADQPGRYIYIKDGEKYWSLTWSPTYHKMDSYECRHGMGYTTIKTESEKILGEVAYFVPDDSLPLEIWRVKIKNKSAHKRKIKLFSYCEFSFYDAVKDQTNVDWCQQINQANYKNNTIFWSPFMKTLGCTFFAANRKIHSFDTSREKFIGAYRSLANPIAVLKGSCFNSETRRGNGIGSVAIEIELNPNEEKETIFILGTTENKDKAMPLIKKYRDAKEVNSAFKSLKNRMKEYIDRFQVKTPDKDLNSMVNLWTQYQCKCAFNWSRFVSLYQLGVNRGKGFRDTAQDTLGVMHTIPEEAKNTLIKLLKIQYKEGYAAHQFYPLTGEIDAGDAAEGTKKAAKWYSDDHLWIVLAVCAYIKETGNFSFLNETIPYIQGGNTSVLEHLESAINYSTTHIGKHGMCLAGWADWDDTLNLDTGKGEAESVWTTMLLGVALKEISHLYGALKKETHAQKYDFIHKKFSKKINSSAGWDGKWYLRAYTDEGKKVGTHLNEKAKIYLLSQSWAVMSGFATGKKAKTALDSAHKLLNTKYGLVLIWPAYDHFDWKIGGTTTYPPGAKENGGIFLQTNPWQIIAQTLVGDGEKAFQYYKQILPSAKNDTADHYEVEPYVYCQNILGKEHPQFGLGRNSWLTGTAAWAMQAVSQYILGIKPDYDGLIIDPCIPAKWKGFEVKKYFRGSNYFITVRNPKGVNKGIKSLTVDGKKYAGNKIPIFTDQQDHHIEAELG